jgi:hypothetical protein
MQPGSAVAWLGFVVALALTIPLIWRAWTIIGPNTYTGGDGKMWQSLIRAVREFAPPFHLNILNPLQGAAAFGSPINVWVNPVYWPFFSDNRLFATQGSTLITYAAVATAIFVLSRIWRVPFGASVVGSLSSLIVFPTFSYIFGFSTLLSIVPDAAMGAATMMIAAGLSYYVSDLRWQTIVRGALVLALWLAYIIYSNPSWFGGAGFVFAPLFAFCILDARSVKVSAARIAAFAIAFALLYALGSVDYIRSLFAYSARIYFSSEWSRPQEPQYASWVFESPRLLWTYLFLVSGWVVGLIFGERSDRKAVVACLVIFSAFLVEVSVYLFAPVHWSATLPLYYEILVAPIYAFGAIVGYSSFLATIWGRLTAEACPNATAPAASSADPAQPLALSARIIRAVPILSAIAFVPVLGTWYVTQEIYTHDYTPSLIATLTEPWAETDELSAYLDENIGLRTTRQFRGMTLLNSGFSYETTLVLANLWGTFVPFLNMYSTFYMPTLYYFMSHLAPPGGAVTSSSETTPPLRAWWTYGHLDASSKKILQALGIRYVFHALPEGEVRRPAPTEAVLRREFGPTKVATRKVTQIVYEYDDPNVGNYSPTEVIVAQHAPAILRRLWMPSFEPRRSVILAEGIGESLVPATEGRMFFERGAIRVRAASRGHSLLLLPVQYSRCLALSEAVGARLLPANLVQTALLFEGSIDLRIRLKYGVLSPGCRRQDLADLARLQIFDEKDILPWAHVHPYGVSTVADLPRAVGAVVKKLTNRP